MMQQSSNQTHCGSPCDVLDDPKQICLPAGGSTPSPMGAPCPAYSFVVCRFLHLLMRLMILWMSRGVGWGGRAALGWKKRLKSVSVSMPWTIAPTLLVLWSVVWMFYYGPFMGYPVSDDGTYWFRYAFQLGWRADNHSSPRM